MRRVKADKIDFVIEVTVREKHQHPFLVRIKHVGGKRKAVITHCFYMQYALLTRKANVTYIYVYLPYNWVLKNHILYQNSHIWEVWRMKLGI